MLVLEDNFSTKLQYETYIALGNFDGLHIGHLSLIKKVVELSKKNNKKSMVLTFKNHPLSIINSSLKPKLLMSKGTKIKFFESLGVDIVNFINFDCSMMKMMPEDFLKNLQYYYNANGIVVGFNFRFGYKNQGNVDLLSSLKDKLNFKTYVMEPVIFDNEVISSSRIRKLIAEGDVSSANKMLMESYGVAGKVVKGRQIGRTLGFPTLNLEIEDSFLIPGRGVYHTVTNINNKLYKSITNVGVNPTVNGQKLTVECHVLDFSEEIYGSSVNVHFINRIRDEKKFNSIDELKEQLNKDRAYVLEK